MSEEYRTPALANSSFGQNLAYPPCSAVSPW